MDCLDRWSKTLVVDTKGICALCFKQSDQDHDKLQPNPHPIGGAKGSPRDYLTLPNYSIQRLSRFLNISIGGLLDLLWIPPSSTHRAYHEYNLDPPDLKVSLCPGCASVTEEFTELHEQLEKIRLQVNHCLSRFCDRVRIGEGGTKKEDFWRRMAANQRDLSCSDLVEQFRKEALQQCATRFNKERPRVLLRKVRKAEIRKYKRKPPPPPAPPPKSKRTRIISRWTGSNNDDLSDPHQLGNDDGEKGQPETEKTINTVWEDEGDRASSVDMPTLEPELDLEAPEVFEPFGFSRGQSPRPPLLVPQVDPASISPTTASPGGKPKHQNGNQIGVNYSHNCHICRMKFRRKVHLNSHVSLRHGHPSGTVDSSDKRSTSTSSCKICHKRFQLKSSLIRHIRQKHGEQRHPPHQVKCHKPFKYAHLLRRHRFHRKKTKISQLPPLMNGNNSDFPCSLCGQKFKHRRDLNRHLASKHSSGDPNRQCPACSKSFAYPADLKKHLDKTHAIPLPPTYKSTGGSRG